ncbi:hypothetical protein CBR_g19773 [Chara braunii]|uniref:Aminopeptidase P N-terminal domain-containing protein n=1 Tax=Chara braunii TaxID=69332 RepID=A0A388JTW8_CHABU|nr:hypothetical protein CBR_g19773 [Chara braunii]|eukprot:GBG61241.1 hypothetical protein CBR_g19773 [Chara braunii]
MAAMVMAPKTGALLNGGATEARPGVFWMGPGTHPVPMSMHAGNRKRLVTKMLKRIQESGGSPRNSVVLLEGGVSETRYCTDHEPLFRQESYFSYLFGVKEPGFYGALDLATGKCFLFMPLLPKDYAVWMGTIHGPEHFKDMYEVDGVFYVEDMPEVLAEMGEGGERPTLYLLQGKNTDSGKMCKPASFKTAHAGHLKGPRSHLVQDPHEIEAGSTYAVEHELAKYIVKIRVQVCVSAVMGWSRS